jgi:transketolase
MDCRDDFASELIAMALADPRIVVVISDSMSTSKLGEFAKAFPDRIFNVGIAEQNLVGVSAGLANGGKIAFACTSSNFLSARALEQIKVDVAYSKANVKLCGVTTGLGYGPLGATHHALEDIAWIRAIPGLPLLAPADPAETRQVVRLVAETDGPFYLRVHRYPVRAVHGPDYVFEFGRADVIRPGRDVTLIATGVMVERALDAATGLSRLGIDARVVNMPTIQPIDRAAIAEAARETAGIVTIEDHSTRGGLGGAVAEVVVQTHPTPMRILGIPGVFAPVGRADFVFTHFGLDVRGIIAAARELAEGALETNDVVTTVPPGDDAPMPASGGA